MECQLRLPGIVSMLKSGPWSAEEIARLRELRFDLKLTTRECAAVLNRSRNSIIGKCNKLRHAEQPLQRKTLGWDFPPQSQCVWPMSDRSPWRFCCEPVAPGRPYCAAHSGIAFIKAPKSDRVFIILPKVAA